ncbi:hypothetical protein EYF80_037621 [Liparis tanakae]|uniref:Uncharacterized protein n=1 Tax=Liparis tanakae TaxID=230148 RepID=A0A4Z2GG28_9TELE|nr:hypothetical protein EYF80_037621 [Liparis tanakae]
MEQLQFCKHVQSRPAVNTVCREETSKQLYAAEESYSCHDMEPCGRLYETAALKACAMKQARYSVSYCEQACLGRCTQGPFQRASVQCWSHGQAGGGGDLAETADDITAAAIMQSPERESEAASWCQRARGRPAACVAATLQRTKPVTPRQKYSATSPVNRRRY